MPITPPLTIIRRTYGREVMHNRTPEVTEHSQLLTEIGAFSCTSGLSILSAGSHLSPPVRCISRNDALWLSDSGTTGNGNNIQPSSPAFERLFAQEVSAEYWLGMAEMLMF